MPQTRPQINVPRPVEANLDVELGHKATDELIAAYRRRYDRYQAELAHERELAEQLQRAVAEDSQTFAKAIDTGDEPEPDRKRTLKAEELLAASQRRSVALARRLNEDYPACVKTVAKHARGIRAQARDDERRAARALLDRLVDLGDAFTELHRSRRIIEQVDWWRGDQETGIPPAQFDQVLLNYDPAGDTSLTRPPSPPWTVENMMVAIVEALNLRAQEDEPGEAAEQPNLIPVPVTYDALPVGHPSVADEERAARQRAG